MMEKIKRVLAGIGIALVALLGWLAGHFKKKAEAAEKRANSMEVQVDVYEKANEAQQAIRAQQEKAKQDTSPDIATAIDDWNNGV